MAVRLEWEGKHQQIERLTLPFQTAGPIQSTSADRRHLRHRMSLLS